MTETVSPYPASKIPDCELFPVSRLSPTRLPRHTIRVLRADRSTRRPRRLATTMLPRRSMCHAVHCNTRNRRIRCRK